MKKCMNRLFYFVCIGVTLSLSFGWGERAVAQEKAYPVREINLNIGAPPGGTLDISGRVLAKVLTKKMGQQVLIINKPGAAQATSVSFVYSSKPDGYSLGFVLNPNPIMKQVEEPSLPYLPENFTCLGAIAKSTLILTVKADSAWKTYEDFIDFSVKKNGRVVFGNDGAGGVQHLFQLQFAEKVGMKKFSSLPFQGGGPAVQALLGGHIQATTVSTGPVAPYVKSGDLRNLVIFGPQRDPGYPNMPTIKEKGLIFYGGSWAAFVGPKGLPPAIAEKLTKAIKEACQDDEVKTIFANIGWAYDYHTPEEQQKLWKAEAVTYAKEMKKHGLLK